MEAFTLARFNAAVASDKSAHHYTFRERCLASGCAWLLRDPIDESRDMSEQAPVLPPPAKRIALATAALLRGPPDGSDPRAVRSQTALSDEAAVRLMVTAIKGYPTYHST